MQKLLTTFLFFLSVVFVQAQCTPDPTHIVGGIYPDSATGLSDAYVGQSYSELITIITPLDTPVVYNGFPLTVTIDSITLDNVTGLPSNFSYYFDPPSCGFLGGTTECAELYSSTNPTSSDVGSYQIIFETTAYVSGIPLIGSTTQNDVIDYYYLNIVNNTPVLDYLPNHVFELSSITPNPIQNNAEISFVSGNYNQQIVCSIYNLLGDKIDSYYTYSKRGLNVIDINTSNYPEGMYLCSMSNGNITLTKRMIISR